jgi:hypothetical protein
MAGQRHIGRLSGLLRQNVRQPLNHQQLF